MVKGPKDVALDLERGATQPLPRHVLQEIGQFAQTLILTRTKRGLDVERHAFKPYSKSYADQRRRKARDPVNVDLAGVRSSPMLGSILPKVTGDNEVSLTFGDTREAQIAVYNNEGTRRSPKREFFDIRAEEELQVLEEIIGTAYYNALTKAT